MGHGTGRGRLVGRGILAWVLVVVGVRLVVLQPERCGPVDRSQVVAAAQRTTDWLVANQHPDGSWLYRYHRGEDRDLGGYNTVRHAGAVAALEQAATAGLGGAEAAAARGSDWARARTVVVPTGRALADHRGADQVAAGASALWAVALVERRQRTGDSADDTLLLDLGGFLAALVTPEGAVLGSFDRDAGRPVPESWSRFYTGEVFWALARLHLAFPEAGFDEPAQRVARYVATRRDDVEGWWPPIADHWAAYGFASVVRWPERAGGPPLRPDEVAYVRRQAALQSLQIRYESQRTDSWWTHLTRGRPALGAGLGTVGEALDQWWLVADAEPRLADLRPVIAERARCAVAVMVARQADDAEARRWASPAQVRGAFFQFDVTQVDDQQHILSALLAALPILAHLR